MLLETPEPNLVAGMRWPQVSYTQRFNARHKECWHLFQGRCKALPVGREGGYFSAVIETVQMGDSRTFSTWRLRLEDSNLQTDIATFHFSLHPKD